MIGSNTTSPSHPHCFAQSNNFLQLFHLPAALKTLNSKKICLEGYFLVFALTIEILMLRKMCECHEVGVMVCHFGRQFFIAQLVSRTIRRPVWVILGNILEFRHIVSACWVVPNFLNFEDCWNFQSLWHEKHKVFWIGQWGKAVVQSWLLWAVHTGRLLQVPNNSLPYVSLI